MARLIDVNKVIKSMQKCLDESKDKKYTVGYCAFESIIEGLKQEPTVDAVEVVRCKDCKRWERHTEVNRDYGGCRRYSSTMRYDDFCSYGERKEGADNG